TTVTRLTIVYSGAHLLTGWHRRPGGPGQGSLPSMYRSENLSLGESSVLKEANLSCFLFHVGRGGCAKTLLLFCAGQLKPIRVGCIKIGIDQGCTDTFFL